MYPPCCDSGSEDSAKSPKYWGWEVKPSLAIVNPPLTWEVMDMVRCYEVCWSREMLKRQMVSSEESTSRIPRAVIGDPPDTP